MKEKFDVRALEIHSLYAWDFEYIVKTLDFMQAHNFNTLVLHRNDFIDLIIYPGKYFGCKKEHYNSIFERYKEIFRSLYKYTPTRRSSPYQRRAFFKRVLEMARRRGIDVYIENKELYFPDIILEFYPHLIKDGKICANDPFWFEFTRVKYKEFFEEFPEVAGVITAPATGESRISIKSNRCTCDLCKNTKKEDWFKSLLMAMYEEIDKAGKTLVVRDFVFDPEAHTEIASVMENLPSNVIISLKNTPHDYFPTFPNNERIGNVGNHKEWIEYDSMGQYFGWGVGIASEIDEFNNRMKFALDRGASGFIVRTDWESLDGHVVFRTPNYINLYAASILGNNINTEKEEVYRKFLLENNYLSSNSNIDEVIKWYDSIFSKTLPIMCKTVYVCGCVFSDSSLMPISYEHAMWLAEEKNSLKDWDKSKADVFTPDYAHWLEIIKEKEEAVKEIEGIINVLKQTNPGLTDTYYNELVDRFGIMKNYVQLFCLVTHIIMDTHVLLKNNSLSANDSEQLIADYKDSHIKLEQLKDLFKEFFKQTDYRPHTIYTLLDPDRIACLLDDLDEKIQSVMEN